MWRLLLAKKQILAEQIPCKLKFTRSHNKAALIAVYLDNADESVLNSKKNSAAIGARAVDALPLIKEGCKESAVAKLASA
jgi:hypothetical protein